MQNIEAVKAKVLQKVEQSGFLDSIRSQLKTQVYGIIQTEAHPTKRKIGWQWQHPKISAVLATENAEACLDLIHDFLQFFKFDYTLSVFLKEAHRKGKADHHQLASRLGINPAERKPCLVKILSGSGFKLSAKPDYNNNSSKTTQQSAASQPPAKRNQKQNRAAPQEQQQAKPKVQQFKKETPPAPPQKSQQQIQLEQREKALQQKRKKREQERQKRLAEAPKNAEDFLKTMIKKQPKKEERALSAPPKKQIQASGTLVGANKIRGSSVGKPATSNSVFGAKSQYDSNPYAFDTGKNPYDFDVQNNDDLFQSSVKQELDELQASKDSRRNNPMFTSSQSMQASQSFGQDKSVDSDQIQNFDHWEVARKRKK